VGDEAHPYNVFDFTLNRGRDGPKYFLRDYNQVLLADAYGGYNGVVAGNQITRAGCWAHWRRKVIDAEKAAPEIAYMFDAVSTHGKWWLTKKFAGREKRRIMIEERLAVLTAQHGEGRVPEADILLVIADVLATTSAERWAGKVRRRKRWFVTGEHPRGRRARGRGRRVFGVPASGAAVPTYARGAGPDDDGEEAQDADPAGATLAMRRDPADVHDAGRQHRRVRCRTAAVR
jgi:hypothetical protein